MRDAFLLLTLLLTPFLSVSAPLTFKTECIGSEQVEVAYQSIFDYNYR